MNRITYYGHHKCASTSTTKTLFLIAKAMKWSVGKHQTLYGDDIEGIPRLYDENQIVIFPNTPPSLQSETRLGFHVIRHPKDIIVSAYFSHLKTHPVGKWKALKSFRKKLQEVSKEQGLILELDFISNVLTDLNNWNYDNPQCIEFKMEEFTKRPYTHWAHVLDRMNAFAVGPKPLFSLGPRQRLTQGELVRIVEQTRFEKLSGGRKPGDENPNSHYRKGTPNDWINHWTPKVEEEFQSRYPDLLRKTGYE